MWLAPCAISRTTCLRTKDVKAYAASIGRVRETVQKEVQAAKVAESVVHMYHDLSAHFRALAEIHAARVAKAVMDVHNDLSNKFSQLVADEVYAARVAGAVSDTDIRIELSRYFSQLVAIHAARPWLWPALVAARPRARAHELRARP